MLLFAVCNLISSPSKSCMGDVEISDVKTSEKFFVFFTFCSADVIAGKHGGDKQRAVDTRRRGERESGKRGDSSGYHVRSVISNHSMLSFEG